MSTATMHEPVFIGIAGRMGSTRLAERSIAMAAAMGRKSRWVVRMNRDNGAVFVAHPDYKSAGSWFVRGVASNSDPDVLAEDIASEADECGLSTKARA